MFLQFLVVRLCRPLVRPRFAIDRASLALFMSVRSKVLTRFLISFLIPHACDCAQTGAKERVPSFGNHDEKVC